MRLFTFDDFAESLNNPMALEHVKRNLLRNDEIPFIPNFVVDCEDARKKSAPKIFPLEAYGLEFQSLAHLAPDRTTVYFVDEQDALMFILAAS